jgi:hypothetical protein
MPTKREREYYAMGYRDGRDEELRIARAERERGDTYGSPRSAYIESRSPVPGSIKPKRKLSAWNKFVKANSRKKEFRYRNGKLNLKKMGVAFRRKKRR